MTSAACDDSVAPASEISRALQRALGNGLLKWLPIGVYACDIDGHLVQYNRRAAELWGRSPAVGNGQYRFCGAQRAYAANGEKLDLAPMAELLSTGTPIRDRELILERPDGSRLTVHANSIPCSRRVAVSSAA
jgi:PAS domain-containing protein